MCIMLIIFCIIWWIIGVYAFINAWTRDLDLGVDMLFFVILVGLLGPINFLIGFMIHHDKLNFHNKVIIKKKKPKEAKKK